MRAYFAIIKDSFRETFASRVLWILLVLITLLLLVLAPLGVKEQAANTLQRGDLISIGAFPPKLVEQAESPKPSPGKHLWKLLSPDLQEQLRQANETGGEQQPIRPLVEELNEALARKDFYDESAWKRYPLGDEGQHLFDRGVDNLDVQELRRFNRLSLDAAYPGDIRPVAELATQIVYFGYDVADPFPADHEQVQQIVQYLLLHLMSFLVGVLGVFVAILVTAAIIPHMFEPGAIDLLLSRPLSRSLLFLSKFVGGCVFILLNAAYLIVGLWCYVGLRFGIWSNKLLLCIPVFLFLFAIYYAVSAWAGVIWKNAVVSVVMTILFWGACFAVGTSKEVVEKMFLNPRRFAVLVPTGESLLAANKSGDTFQWHAEDHTWQEVFRPQSKRADPLRLIYPMVGPIYDARSDQLVAIQSSSPRMPGFAGTGKIVIGKRSEGWQRISGVASPGGTHELFVDSNGMILAVGTAGIFRFEGDPSIAHVPFKVLGVDVAPQGKAGKFVNVGPDGHDSWLPPFAAARHPQSGNLVLFSRGKITLLRPDEKGKFSVEKETDLDTKEPALVATSGDVVLVALGNGDIRLFDVKTLDPGGSFHPNGTNKPHQVAAAENGRWFAVQFDNNKLWLYDATTEKPLQIAIAGQGSISAATFTADNKLLVADGYPRVIEYDLNNGTPTRRFETETEVLERVYRYIISPIYTVFPKPGELDNMVAYLLTDEKTAPTRLNNQSENLQAERLKLNIWQPVWSNLAFLVVILGLTCWYIERKDF